MQIQEILYIIVFVVIIKIVYDIIGKENIRIILFNRCRYVYILYFKEFEDDWRAYPIGVYSNKFKADRQLKKEKYEGCSLIYFVDKERLV